MELEASRDARGLVHDQWRSSSGVDVVERRLCRAVATWIARVVEVLAVRAAAWVAAVLSVVATTTVGVRRVPGILGRQKTRLCPDWDLHHALSLHHARQHARRHLSRCLLRWLKIFVQSSLIVRQIARCISCTVSRTSAVAERPRDASYH